MSNTMNDIDEVRGKYRLGGLQHRMIAALSKNDMGGMELKAVIKSSLPSHDFRAELKRLAREKLVIDTGNDTWSITSQGLNASVLLGAVPTVPRKSRKLTSERICNGNMTTDYVPQELGFTCLRQGAYDAFLLPSRIGNKLHYPNGRIVESLTQSLNKETTMTQHPFDIPRNSALMAHIKKMDTNRKVSKGTTRWVETQRKLGTDPCADLNLNANANRNLLGKKEKK